MNNTFQPHKLDNREKNLLGYELSTNKDHAYYVLVEYQSKFNEIYKIFINLFRRIFLIRKNNKNDEKEINKILEKLFEVEQLIINKYKILLFYAKLYKSDFSNTDIYLEFENKEEEKRLFDNLEKRKVLLEKFNKQIEMLEVIKKNINSVYEKTISNSCLELPKK